MAALAICAKALGLILLAVLIFTGFAAALDVDFVGNVEGRCAGSPLTACFLTII